MPTLNRAERMIQKMTEASLEMRETYWQIIKTPIIDDIDSQPNDCLVTFLYRFKEKDERPQVYLFSSVLDFCSEQTKLISVPNTDIGYVSLVFPRTLRTTYNFLSVDDEHFTGIPSETDTDDDYPKLKGKTKEEEDRYLWLFNHGKIGTDPYNQDEINYYNDCEIPDILFHKESILELPSAVNPVPVPYSWSFIKAERDQLRSDNRFFDCIVDFAETSLRDVAGYHETSSQATRKYQIYLPHDYDEHADEPYPLMLFLDGMVYVDAIPSPAILDRMIQDSVIPPCVAVFLDYSSEQRMKEYCCDAQFTDFLANDFISLLHHKNKLHIMCDPTGVTVVGSSASGLAAFYAGMRYPNIFGHVIAQSPSLGMKKIRELETLVDQHDNQYETNVMFEVGAYETQPHDLAFRDGSSQAISPVESTQHLYAYMRDKGMNVSRHEFVGGHNYVCWRASLPDRIQEVLQDRLVARHAYGCK